MPKLTITLSDAEYAALQQRAESERRTPRQMAEWLVVQPQQIFITAPYVQPQPRPGYIWPPAITCDGAGTTNTPSTNGTVMFGSSGTATYQA